MTRNKFLKSFFRSCNFLLQDYIRPKQNYMKYKKSQHNCSGHVTHYMILNNSRKPFFHPVIFQVRMLIQDIQASWLPSVSWFLMHSLTSPMRHMGRPQSADKKFVGARGPQNWNPKVFDQTRCSRTFACRICPEQQRIGQGKSVREKKSQWLKRGRLGLLGLLWNPKLTFETQLLQQLNFKANFCNPSNIFDFCWLRFWPRGRKRGRQKSSRSDCKLMFYDSDC